MQGNSQLRLHPLEERRRLAGLSATGLAQKSGIAISTISGIENRRRAGTVATLKRLAAALDCAAGDLVEDAHVES